MSATPVNPVTHVRSLLDGWTPPGPDPVEEAKTVAHFAELFDDPDFDVESLRSLRESYAEGDRDEVDAIAHRIVRDLHRLATLPGPRHWTRWKATRRLASLLYVTGITRSGGSISWGGLDPHGATYTLPRLADVLPSKYGRPYILWMDQKFRECLRAQINDARHHRRPATGWHRPGSADIYGICGRCIPWPCCESTTPEHHDNCPEQGAMEVAS